MHARNTVNQECQAYIMEVKKNKESAEMIVSLLERWDYKCSYLTRQKKL